MDIPETFEMGEATSTPKLTNFGVDDVADNGKNEAQEKQIRQMKMTASETCIYCTCSGLIATNYVDNKKKGCYDAERNSLQMC